MASTNSRAIVEGALGLGKTTFVNRLKTALARHGVLTHGEPVRVTPGMSSREFAGEVLKALLQMYATLQATAAWVAGTCGPSSLEPRLTVLCHRPNELSRLTSAEPTASFSSVCA